MAASMKFRVFWDVAPCFVLGADRHVRGAINRPDMEAVRTSESSVCSKETTWRYISEDSKLQE
jgi:hypothetical protein